ncbi:hypothetical protein VWH97_07075 [Escherichia coli O157]|nr:hypothetical protein [Escherichia coli O157]USL83596.1 hypothetical protein A4_520 [Escherichia phage A4]
MDETDIELLIQNNLSVEIESEDVELWNSDGSTSPHKRITVKLLYGGSVISTTETSL